MQFSDVLDLEQTGPDTFVGRGPRYRWGGLYGGQIVAQALRAAAATVESPMLPHSLRAYFIRRGDHLEPVRYEVDRIRDGRSFTTRRVVAHQAGGAILNLEASFHRGEAGPDVQTIEKPIEVPGPDALENSSWTTMFDRRQLPEADVAQPGVIGRATAWMRSTSDLGDDPTSHMGALAYISDDLPTDAVVVSHPVWPERRGLPEHDFVGASLDHTIWFHRPFRADEWHLYDMRCHGFNSSRGLTIGHVFTESGTHIATIAQEVLLRDSRAKR